MGLLLCLCGHVIAAILYLLAIACDVLFFFLVVGFLATKWPTVVPFARLSRVGAPIVEPLLSAVGKLGVSSRATFLVLSIVLIAFRFCLVVVIGSLVTVEPFREPPRLSRVSAVGIEHGNQDRERIGGVVHVYRIGSISEDGKGNRRLSGHCSEDGTWQSS